jgi:hypothetical protein
VASRCPFGPRPFGQLGQVFELVVAQQLQRAGLLVAFDALQRRREIGLHAVGQTQQRAALDQWCVGTPAQAKQPLAQIGVGLLGAGGGPQHRGQVVGLHRPRQRDHREQGGVFGRQHDHLAAARRHERGLSQQAQLPGLA